MNVKDEPPAPGLPSDASRDAGPPPGARNAARSAATRGRLLAAARPLFGEHGFAGVGTEEIVRAAGVTRGALYHHFRDKEDLFAAVYEQVEAELTQRVIQEGAGEGGPVDALRRGAQVFLDACREPDIQRIVLIDAPSVMGWETWREVGERHALGLVEALLDQAMVQGEIERLPLRPLALMLIGAIDEAALMVARAAGDDATRSEVGRVVDWMVSALRR